MIRARRGDPTLAHQERGPQLRHARDRRDRRVDLGRADRVGDVLAADLHLAEAARRVGNQPDLVDERDEPGRVRLADPAPERQPRDGPIEEARIAEAVAEPGGRGRPDAALAGRARSVQGDHEPEARLDLGVVRHRSDGSAPGSARHPGRDQATSRLIVAGAEHDEEDGDPGQHGEVDLDGRDARSAPLSITSRSPSTA